MRISRVRRGLACLTTVLIATPAIGTAQGALPAGDSSASACPVLNGVRIAADWGDTTSGGTRDSFRLGGRTAIDTTLTFDVAERQWTRPWLRAYVAGGVSGRARTAGSAAIATGGADSRSSWHACVGVLLGMQQPTLIMRGVRGQMHVKIDLTPLTRIPGATLDSSRQNDTRR